MHTSCFQTDKRKNAKRNVREEGDALTPLSSLCRAPVDGNVAASSRRHFSELPELRLNDTSHEKLVCLSSSSSSSLTQKHLKLQGLKPEHLRLVSEPELCLRSPGATSNPPTLTHTPLFPIREKHTETSFISREEGGA